MNNGGEEGGCDEGEKEEKDCTKRESCLRMFPHCVAMLSFFIGDGKAILTWDVGIHVVMSSDKVIGAPSP